jgi:hypothetical protein
MTQRFSSISRKIGVNGSFDIFKANIVVSIKYFRYHLWLCLSCERERKVRRNQQGMERFQPSQVCRSTVCMPMLQILLQEPTFTQNKFRPRLKILRTYPCIHHQTLWLNNKINNHFLNEQLTIVKYMHAHSCTGTY